MTCWLTWPERMTISILTEFVPLDELWSGEAPAYPSEQSARWVVRQYRKALLDGNALALSRGRLFVHPARFARVMEDEAINALRRRDCAEGSGQQGRA